MNLDVFFEHMIDEIAHYEPAEALPLIAKLFEEGGEFSEATLVDQGFCQHKELKEEAVGECADVIIAALGVLVKLKSMEGKEPNVILYELQSAMQTKFKKYQVKILHKNEFTL